MEQTKALMKEHQAIRNEIKENINSTVNHGCVLLECITGESKEVDADSGVVISSGDTSVTSTKSLTYPSVTAGPASLEGRDSLCEGNKATLGKKDNGAAVSAGPFSTDAGSDNRVKKHHGRGSVCVLGVVLQHESRNVPRCKLLHLQAVERCLLC